MINQKTQSNCQSQFNGPLIGRYSAELYDRVSMVWSVTASLNTPRLRHTATLLANGKVLVAGGCNLSGHSCDSLNSAELFEQDVSPSISISDAVVTEGKGTVNVTFQVNLSAPSSQPV